MEPTAGVRSRVWYLVALLLIAYGELAWLLHRRVFADWPPPAFPDLGFWQGMSTIGTATVLVLFVSILEMIPLARRLRRAESVEYGKFFRSCQRAMYAFLGVAIVVALSSCFSAVWSIKAISQTLMAALYVSMIALWGNLLDLITILLCCQKGQAHS